MEVDKQLKFKSQERMQVEFIANNVDEMTHDCLSSVAQALDGAFGYILMAHFVTLRWRIRLHKCQGHTR